MSNDTLQVRAVNLLHYWWLMHDTDELCELHPEPLKRCEPGGDLCLGCKLHDDTQALLVEAGSIGPIDEDEEP